MFLIIPVAVDYRARRRPVVTYTIMGLCALVYVISFLVWLSGGEEADYKFMLRFGFVREELNWYSWFSHLFTHADIFHLLGNMAYLYLFGSCVEDLVGRGNYVVFYLLGGLAALGVYLLFAPPSVEGDVMIPLVGASGAISACMGAFFLVLHRTSINLKWVLIFFFRLFSGDWHLSAKLVMSFWFLSDVLGMILDSGSGGGVAFSAHVGGFLGGMLLMLILKYTLGFLPDEDDANLAPAPRAFAGAVALPPATMLWINGSQLGPFNRPQIQQMLELGSIDAGALFWEEGMGEWRSVQEL